MDGIMKDQLLHNPRCSKSRQALALLEDKSAGVPLRRYLDEPLSEAEIRQLVTLLGVRPIEICRRGEAMFKELGLGPDTKDAEVIRQMAAHPILIERPILVYGGRARVGRPPEDILEII
jgi:arsenate reductase